MRTFNFTLLAALSYVAVIGATPLGARAPAEVIDHRQLPDCDVYPNAPECVACEINPRQPFCRGLCHLNPEASFCSRFCNAEPWLSFCNESDSETINRRRFPDCNEHPNAPKCVACNHDPRQPFCRGLCDLNPETSFCPVICEAEPGLSFCSKSDSETIDRRQLPDCNEYPNAPECVACEFGPYRPVCGVLCSVNPEASFCSRFCNADPGLPFLECGKSSTSD